ncbi:unnamed protein product [Brugia timori]|uniref:Uncharacterized protein n=1 Tax=Brugia timori TaxID=42155 RepID=A0A0R3QQB0_9BILA|nr:unnamed protein product [Brugia timori]
MCAAKVSFTVLFRFTFTLQYSRFPFPYTYKFILTSTPHKFNDWYEHFTLFPFLTIK